MYISNKQLGMRSQDPQGQCVHFWSSLACADDQPVQIHASKALAKWWMQQPLILSYDSVPKHRHPSNNTAFKYPMKWRHMCTVQSILPAACTGDSDVTQARRGLQLSLGQFLATCELKAPRITSSLVACFIHSAALPSCSSHGDLWCDEDKRVARSRILVVFLVCRGHWHEVLSNNSTCKLITLVKWFASLF
jgi:hypothetical protein